VKIINANIMVAIISGLAFLPIRYIQPTKAAYYQDIFSSMIFPVFLCLINMLIYLKAKSFALKSMYLIIPLACVLIHLVGYLNYCIYYGKFSLSDPEGFVWIRFFLLLSIGVGILNWSIIHFVLHVIKKG